VPVGVVEGAIGPGRRSFFKAGWFVLVVVGLPGILDLAQAQVEKAWVATYDGPGKGWTTPTPSRSTGMATSSSPGSSGVSGPTGICTTLKYAPDGRCCGSRGTGACSYRSPTMRWPSMRAGNACVAGSSGATA